MDVNISIIGYVALFIMDEQGIYYVEFPDLPGCYTQGETLEIALCNAQEALAIYYQETKGELPVGSDLLSIQKKYPNAIAQMVVINPNNHIAKSLRIVKKTLTIPEWLNDVAIKYQVNFSLILKNALINYLKNKNDVSQYDKKMLNE